MKRWLLTVILAVFLSADADAAVVFTDSFTSGSDADLIDYDAAHYDENTVEANYHLYVNSANSRVQSVATDGNTSIARVIGAGVPTGDQKITATVSTDGSNEYTGLIVRDDSTNFYLAFFYNDGPPHTIEIYRYDGGAFTLLTSGARSFSYPATASFQATGTGATVSLQVIIGGTAAINYNDTDAGRITSGYPGLRIYTNAKTEAAYFDDLVIDDLSAPPAAAIVRRTPIILQ